MSRFLVERYAVGGPLLAYATAELKPEHAIARPGPGSWSLAELVAHLLDCDLVFAERIKRVIAEDNPILQAFEENAWIDRLDSHAMPVEEGVNLFVANRHWMTRILRSRPDEDFARTGRHTEVGLMTLADIIAKASAHLDHHLRFAYAKRGNLGTAIPPKYAPVP